MRAYVGCSIGETTNKKHGAHEGPDLYFPSQVLEL